MKKTLLIISMFLLICQMTTAQEKLDFNSIPTLWITDSLQVINTADLEFETLSQAAYLDLYPRPQPKTTEEPTIKPDSTGRFVVNTKQAHYEFYQTTNYNSSYSYFGFMPELNSHIIGFCGSGMCEDYLLDHDTDEKLLIPSSYDAGMQGLLLAPSKERLLIFSSYDGPDYQNYYEYRAEILLYAIAKNKGLNGLKPTHVFHSLDWSIEDMYWISDTSLALKIYKGARIGDGSTMAYDYLKLQL